MIFTLQRWITCFHAFFLVFVFCFVSCSSVPEFSMKRSEGSALHFLKKMLSACGAQSFLFQEPMQSDKTPEKVPVYALDSSKTFWHWGVKLRSGDTAYRCVPAHLKHYLNALLFVQLFYAFKLMVYSMCFTKCAYSIILPKLGTKSEKKKKSVLGRFCFGCNNASWQ